MPMVTAIKEVKNSLQIGKEIPESNNFKINKITLLIILDKNIPANKAGIKRIYLMSLIIQFSFLS